MVDTQTVESQAAPAKVSKNSIWETIHPWIKAGMPDAHIFEDEIHAAIAHLIKLASIQKKNVIEDATNLLIAFEQHADKTEDVIEEFIDRMKNYLSRKD